MYAMRTGLGNVGMLGEDMNGEYVRKSKVAETEEDNMAMLQDLAAVVSGAYYTLSWEPSCGQERVATARRISKCPPGVEPAAIKLTHHGETE